MKPIILFLTCKDQKEADKIIRSLLNHKLIACAKKINIDSSFWWQGKIESSPEVLIIMESLDVKFSTIEKEIRKLHSYQTFVLNSLAISKTSKGVLSWLKSSLG